MEDIKFPLPPYHTISLPRGLSPLPHTLQCWSTITTSHSVEAQSHHYLRFTMLKHNLKYQSPHLTALRLDPIIFLYLQIQPLTIFLTSYRARPHALHLFYPTALGFYSNIIVISKFSSSFTTQQWLTAAS